MRPRVEIGTGLMVGVCLAGCATTAGTNAGGAVSTVVPLAITNVGVEPKTIDPAQRQIATIRYELSRPATVTVDLVDEEGRVVRQLDAGKQSAGMRTATWDGCMTNGRPVPSGVYLYIIRTSTVYGLPTTDYSYDPSTTTGSEELEAWKFTFDKETGLLRWVMPKAGYARVRIGVQGFPHLRTLLDWEPLEAGEQTIAWDGLDASGLINLKEHPNLSIKLQAFALPWNTIIVRNGSSSADEPSSPRLPSGPRGGQGRADEPAYPPLNRRDASYLHAQHARAVCHETRLHVQFPAETSYDSHSRPVLSGVVAVRVVLDERDAAQAVNSRFEVAFFEDLTFLSEEEDGSNPFTYLWDTTHLPPGEHLLTVNVLSYDDHYGVVTVPVMIEGRS